MILRSPRFQCAAAPRPAWNTAHHRDTARYDFLHVLDTLEITWGGGHALCLPAFSRRNEELPSWESIRGAYFYCLPNRRLHASEPALLLRKAAACSRCIDANVGICTLSIDGPVKCCADAGCFAAGAPLSRDSPSRDRDRSATGPIP